MATYSGEIAAHSAYDMFSTYMFKYLIVNLVFHTSVFGVGISFWLHLFLIIAYLFPAEVTSRFGKSRILGYFWFEITSQPESFWAVEHESFTFQSYLFIFCHLTTR